MYFSIYASKTAKSHFGLVLGTRAERVDTKQSKWPAEWNNACFLYSETTIEQVIHDCANVAVMVFTAESGNAACELVKIVFGWPGNDQEPARLKLVLEFLGQGRHKGHMLQYFQGDNLIQAIIWDLISPGFSWQELDIIPSVVLQKLLGGPQHQIYSPARYLRGPNLQQQHASSTAKIQE